jgi:Tfp pilus assembly protein PilV
MPHLHRRSGQTLIELLIATTVIATGLFATSTLVLSNLRLSDRDADEIVAVNLAREGIELAKARRDANWLAGQSFDLGLKNDTDYSAVPLWTGVPGSLESTFDFAPTSIADDAAVIHASQDAESPGFYSQRDRQAPALPWRRLLTFHPICDTGSGFAYLNDGETCASDPLVGIRVESHVRWVRKGLTFDRVMYEDLFDWR